jgi:hypothetical protein
MALFYAITGIGACIREARDIRSAHAAVLREVGEYNGVKEVRKATKADISWVKGMGGQVPEKRKVPNVEFRPLDAA